MFPILTMTNYLLSAHHKSEARANNVNGGTFRNNIGGSKVICAYHKSKARTNNVNGGTFRNNIGGNKVIGAYHKSKAMANNVNGDTFRNNIGGNKRFYAYPLNTRGIKKQRCADGTRNGYSYLLFYWG